MCGMVPTAVRACSGFGEEIVYIACPQAARTLISYERKKGGGGCHRGEVSLLAGTCDCAHWFEVLETNCPHCLLQAAEGGGGIFWVLESGGVVPLLMGGGAGGRSDAESHGRRHRNRARLVTYTWETPRIPFSGRH